MASRRKASSATSARLNFRPPLSESNRTGTKPTSTPTSVKEIITLMILHLCRKSLFYDTNLKVALYLGSLFVISLIADVFSIPRGYFSRSSNVINQYFVKFAWGWNLLLLVPYVLLTTYIYCCGQKDKILKRHLPRLAIATFFWWFWTSLFQYIEIRYGRCSVRAENLNSKQSCLKAGYLWNGFDISGHSFILIYGSLLFIEETRSMINWDSIKDYIRLEEHYRVSKDINPSTNPLRSLSENHFQILQANYEKFTPYIRGLFIVITIFQILWDIMLMTTMLYFHNMVEKFIGGVCAILTWFFTYRFWYSRPNLLPSLPGDGLFKYNKSKAAVSSSQSSSGGRKRSGSFLANDHSQVYKFMGMPLYGLKPDVNLQNPQTDDIFR